MVLISLNILFLICIHIDNLISLNIQLKEILITEAYECLYIYTEAISHRQRDP